MVVPGWSILFQVAQAAARVWDCGGTGQGAAVEGGRVTQPQLSLPPVPWSPVHQPWAEAG